MVSRRGFLKLSGITAGGLALTSNGFIRVLAETAAAGLSDPALQPKFANPVPDALAPGFIYQPDNKGRYKIKIGSAVQQTGLWDNPTDKNLLSTPVWGYGDQKDKFISWPGRTFQIQSGTTETQVTWANALDGITQHLLPLDPNLHWCYSLHGYAQYSIANNGVPIITHLHGGHTDFQFDGNPEFFYSPEIMGQQVVGPQWANVPGGFTTKFRYDNDVPAGNLWYHDHALGITRLNVYAGMAGFYFVRDTFDTGLPGNAAGLPAWPYEKAYAIQDRMFLATGELFYPAYPGDPFYAGFITDEGVTLSPPEFPDNPRNEPGFIGGGPTALAEFFGDHMIVNGLIWPKEDVEPRNYRLHLLNGTDSRFMGIRFREVDLGATTIPNSAPTVTFWVVGSDQGLADGATPIGDFLLSEPGSRYDIVVDFSASAGKRVIMENIAGDAPFGGDFFDPLILTPEEIEQAVEDGDLFPDRQTDRIMSFDVVLNIDDATSAAGLPPNTDVFVPGAITNPHIPNENIVNRWRKVALFEGKDEFGRLQPLLGTAEPATDWDNQPINWPDEPKYAFAGLLPTEKMEGSIAWDSPTTENPAFNSTEEWEIWNMTGDAHPVHLHLVHFDVLGRQAIKFDSNADEDGFIPDGDSPADDGVYLVTQPTVQHNSVAGDPATYGIGFKIVHPSNPADAYGPVLSQPAGYVENSPKDMVTALPGQITRIKASFDKPGRYVWHCHILSHEDHEMMRVLHVGPIP